MTPAVRWLKAQGVPFELHPFDADGQSGYAQAAAAGMGVSAERVFKTLMVQSDQGLACMMVPAHRTLNLKRAAKTLGAKRAQMASTEEAERVSGYRVGGISAFGQKRPCPQWIDASAFEFERVYLSAGQRGLDLSLDPKDLEALGIQSALLTDL